MLREKTANVSLIISHYNKAKFLEQAVYSGINQSVRPKEIIVVDDCSYPRQRTRAEEICDRMGVRLILRKTNGGPSVARNDGIRVSSGQWIQIVDADDYLTRKSLESRLKVLQTNPDVLWIAGHCAKVPWFVTPRSMESRLLKCLPWYKLKPEPVIEPNDVPPDDPWVVKWPHVTILFHRTLFEKYGLYDEMVRLGQDKEIRWRFWYFSQTVPLAVSEIVYAYRRGVRGQLTHKTNNPGRQISLRIMMDNIQRRKSEGLRPENTDFIDNKISRLHSVRQ